MKRSEKGTVQNTTQKSYVEPPIVKLLRKFNRGGYGLHTVVKNVMYRLEITKMEYELKR